MVSSQVDSGFRRNDELVVRSRHRHPGANRDPEACLAWSRRKFPWIPAFAGMTNLVRSRHRHPGANRTQEPTSDGLVASVPGFRLSPE